MIESLLTFSRTGDQGRRTSELMAALLERAATLVRPHGQLGGAGAMMAGTLRFTLRFLGSAAVAFSGDGAPQILLPLVFLVIIGVSWALRPASRRVCASTNRVPEAAAGETRSPTL